MLLRNLLHAGFASIILISTAWPAHVSAGKTVSSMQKLGEKQDNTGNTYFHIRVNCNGRNEARFIQQYSDSNLWCVSGLPSECTRNKIRAAGLACRSELPEPLTADVASNSVALGQSTEAVNKRERRRALQDELLQQEQKQLEINSRKLELRKRELELVRQQVGG